MGQSEQSLQIPRIKNAKLYRFEFAKGVNHRSFDDFVKVFQLVKRNEVVDRRKQKLNPVLTDHFHTWAWSDNKQLRWQYGKPPILTHVNVPSNHVWPIVTTIFQRKYHFAPKNHVPCDNFLLYAVTITAAHRDPIYKSNAKGLVTVSTAIDGPGMLRSFGIGTVLWLHCTGTGSLHESYNLYPLPFNQYTPAPNSDLSAVLISVIKEKLTSTLSGAEYN